MPLAAEFVSGMLVWRLHVALIELLTARKCFTQLISLQVWWPQGKSDKTKRQVNLLTNRCISRGAALVYEYTF